ncbi:MAG: serine--tRNA ligase, partial [Patescibacteria group bacterium]|nr:serine--tRNA ligase [Patescibacteria group bacterium]
SRINLISSWGEKPEFKFKAKNHIELAKNLDLIDLERGVKVAGFRGYYLKNQTVKLQLALFNFTIDKLLKESFTPM